MKLLSINDLADIFGAELEIFSGTETVIFEPQITGFSIDCRDVNPGDIFFVLNEPRFDHLQYMMLAQQHGAIVAVVEQIYPEVNLPQIVVDNSFESLIATVKWWSKDQNTETSQVINSLRAKTYSSLTG